MNALMARRNTRLPAMMAKNNLSKRSTPETHNTGAIGRFWLCRFFDSRQAKFRQVVRHQGGKETFSKCYRKLRASGGVVPCRFSRAMMFVVALTQVERTRCSSPAMPANAHPDTNLTTTQVALVAKTLESSIRPARDSRAGELLRFR